MITTHKQIRFADKIDALDNEGSFSFFTRQLAADLFETFGEIPECIDIELDSYFAKLRSGKVHLNKKPCLILDIQSSLDRLGVKYTKTIVES